MDMNGILIIIGIVVLLGIAGGCVFGVLKVREALVTLDTRIDPKLDDLKAKTEALKPAVAQVEGLMQSVNVTLDALDMTIVEVDGKLEQLSNLTSTVAGIGEAIPQAAESAKTSVKASLLNRTNRR